MNHDLPDPVGAKQIASLGHDLDRLIDRYVDEYDLPVATIMGVLQFKVTLLAIDSIEAGKEEEESRP